LGHGKYAGTGLTNFFIPGQVPELDLNTISLPLLRINFLALADVIFTVGVFLAFMIA